MEQGDFERLIKIANRIGLVLEELKLSLATAESCTGGWLSHILTSIETSSTWFERGFVTYSDEAKVTMLGVKQATIDEFTAVSKQTSLEMAKGALRNSLADVSVAITGMAGPTSTDGTPVGTCWIAWASDRFQVKAEKKHFDGDRWRINYQAVEYALSHLLEILNGVSKD